MPSCQEMGPHEVAGDRAPVGVGEHRGDGIGDEHQPHDQADALGLRGTVERLSQRRAAAEDAAKIDGVYEVVNHLKVNVLGVDSREDDEIRGAALQSVIWDADVPDSVDVAVREEWVTLKGQVSEQYQSDAAYDDVSRLYGVYGVTNEIVVSNL